MTNDTDKIIGLIDTTRGFTFKLIADLYGGPRFENADFFSTKKALCKVEDEEEVSEVLYGLAKRDVMRAVNRAIVGYKSNGTFPFDDATGQPLNGSIPSVSIETLPEHQPAPPQEPEYVVAEKPAPAATTKPDTPKTLGDRLNALGVTKDELMTCVRFKFPDHPQDKTFTREQYLAAFTEAEAFLKQNGIEIFRRELHARLTPPKPVSQTITPHPDPAVAAAMVEVSKKFPGWSTQICQIAGSWCADHVKDAAALEAFLIAAGVTEKTPPGKIECLLAISRHLAYGSATVILKLSQDTGKPLSQIEAEITQIVGKDIRMATDIPDGVVSTAFNALAVAARK